MSFDFDDRQSIESSIYAVEVLLEKLIDYEKSEEKFIRDYMLSVAHLCLPNSLSLGRAKVAWQTLSKELSNEEAE
jgi:hypothetical protein